MLKKKIEEVIDGIKRGASAEGATAKIVGDLVELIPNKREVEKLEKQDKVALLDGISDEQAAYLINTGYNECRNELHRNLIG